MLGKLVFFIVKKTKIGIYEYTTNIIEVVFFISDRRRSRNNF